MFSMKYYIMREHYINLFFLSFDLIFMIITIN